MESAVAASEEAPRPFWHYVVLAGAVVVLTAMTLLLMGREPWSKNGYLLLFAPDVLSSDTSQQISDWYTPSHIIHGIAFYALFRLGSRGRWSAGACLVAAVALEAAWEIFENTPFTIDRYRAATISLNYYGDTVLNSVCDILACVLGFFVAARAPVWISVTIVLLLEVFVLLMIRDNLTLNIVMFLYPFDAILKWQQGG